MKKLLFGLIATVMFGFGANAQSDFDAVGLQHNKVLEVLLTKCGKNVNKTNVFDISKSLIIQNFPEYKNTQFIKFDSYSTPENLLEQISKKGLISTTLYNLVVTDLKTLKQLDSYSKVASFVENAKSSSALKNLSKEDSLSYMNYLSVLKHSSYFWDVEGKNGMSIGVLYPPTAVSKFSLFKMWFCDAAGAFAGGAGAPISSFIYYVSEYPY